jgi:ribonuclease Y
MDWLQQSPWWLATLSEDFCGGHYSVCRRGSPENCARSERDAESKKREALVEAREEIHRLRSEMEREARERRAELNQFERRVSQKEEILDKRSDSLERKEEALQRKSREVDQRQNEVNELLEKQRQELERISHLTTDEARELILKSVEEEVKHETAILIRELETQAREELRREPVISFLSRFSALP